MGVFRFGIGIHEEFFVRGCDSIGDEDPKIPKALWHTALRNRPLRDLL